MCAEPEHTALSREHRRQLRATLAAAQRRSVIGRGDAPRRCGDPGQRGDGSGVGALIHAANLAPDEIPTKMPSLCASERAAVIASSSAIARLELDVHRHVRRRELVDPDDRRPASLSTRPARREHVDRTHGIRSRPELLDAVFVLRGHDHERAHDLDARDVIDHERLAIDTEVYRRAERRSGQEGVAIAGQAEAREHVDQLVSGHGDEPTSDC
jgi:hypothetical protein